MPNASCPLVYHGMRMRAYACICLYTSIPHSSLVEPHPSTAAGTTTIHIMPAPLPLRAKGNRSLADYPGRGGWVRCVVLGVLPSRGSSLLAVLCPRRGAPVDCSPELPWEKEESYQRCLCLTQRVSSRRLPKRQSLAKCKEYSF